MQENLAVTVSQATIDRVAAHDRDHIGILLGLVFPKNLAAVIEVKRKDGIRKRTVDIHDIADDQWAALVSAQDASGERPGGLQLRGILRGDLFELRVAMVRV